MSLSRFDMPSKYYVQHRSRLVGLYRDQLPQPVSMPWWPCPMLPSPGRATSRFILPWRSPPQSSFAHFSRPASFDPSMPTQGFGPHRDITGKRPLGVRDAMPSLGSAHRLSQPLDGLLRSPASQACFIPQPRPGLSPFRGFSPRAVALPHRKRLPPCR